MADATSGVTVVRVSLENLSTQWDAFVHASPQVNPFADCRWLRAMRDIRGMEVEVWIACRGEEWLAAIPIFARKRLGRMVALHPALTAYTSILYAPSLRTSQYPSRVTAHHIEVTKPLLAAVRGAYASTTAVLLPSVTDVRPWIWDGWRASPTYTYELNLGESLAVSASVRKHVAKCERSGVTLSTTWDLARAWGPIESTIGRQGVGIGMSKPVFMALAEQLHRDGLAWMATAIAQDGTPLAVRIQLSIEGSATVFDWVAGSDARHLALGGTPWLMTRMAEEIRQRGHATWNLCGAQYETIAKFKSEFGGRLVHGFSVTGPAVATEQMYLFARASASRLKRAIQRRRRGTRA